MGIEQYINLPIGEIPRFTDNENGYAPKGKGYIVHSYILEKNKVFK